MGYYVDITECQIFIKKEDFDSCYKAMCELNKLDDLKTGGSWSSDGKHNEKWFSWMDKNYPDKCKTMEDILYELGFEALAFDNDGNLVDLCYNNKIGSEDLFFNSISPWVKSGSYINWVGEDNSTWQYSFNNGSMSVKTGRIVFQ